MRAVIIRAVALAATMALCTAAAAEPVTVRIGFASVGVDNRQFSGGSAASVAHAEHYLETDLKDQPDVKIEWYFFKGAGPAVNEAVANGQLDFALQGDLPSVIGRANGLKTKILMASGAHAPTYLAVPEGSAITAVKELRGKKVAIFRGTNNHLAVVKVLAANGLSERDLQVLNMDNATTNSALASKDVDAAFGNWPLISLNELGRAKIIYSTKGDNPAFERHSTVLVTEAFERAHPQLVATIVKSFVRAARWASDEANREALLEIWARSGTPASVFRYDFAGQELRYRNSPLIDPFLVEQYAVQARQAKEFGLVRRDVDVSGWFEPRYVDQALRELGLESYWTRYGANGKPLGS
ncbi:MAG TPA: ABC transporter substrate-binding protein [Xanthobacteraceae bacterium]|nr:ABC transporter substrate-binding protein [Xanthobacteraceae bacterium]